MNGGKRDGVMMGWYTCLEWVVGRGLKGGAVGLCGVSVSPFQGKREMWGLRSDFKGFLGSVPGLSVTADLTFGDGSRVRSLGVNER
jgi:hypothetical protein